MDFKQRIHYYIEQQHLLNSNSKYLVALSGGADSVALLLVLHELGYHTEAIHCNFHLRGEESDRDELFCMELCDKLHIPFHRIHFETKEYALLHKESIELAARNLRYRYFEQLRKDVGAEGICVAHHQDDSVETILINLIRGTGINGLTGISPRNGYVLRPLLGVDRKEILAYLGEKGQSYVTDSTNLVDDVVRNKIRLRILPMLRAINPSASQNIAAAANHLAEAQKTLRALLAEKQIVRMQGDIVSVDKKLILEQASPEYALYASLEPFGFRGKAIREILSGIDHIGKTWLSGTHQLAIDRDSILVRPLQEYGSKPLRMPETGVYAIGEYGRKIALSLMERPEDFKPSKQSHVATLDADKVCFPLTLRLMARGDRFRPFGMKGSKLVSDYLTDQKCNYFEKQGQEVIEDANQQIVWVVGRRTADPCKITPHTRHILKIEMR